MSGNRPFISYAQDKRRLQNTSSLSHYMPEVHNLFGPRATVYYF